MPANKNALIRYKTIDRCLSNRYRMWTLDDLVAACADALYEMEGITSGVSLRTVQSDIQIMRSDKLGYNAPIEVYRHKYYRYSDPDYTISDATMTAADRALMAKTIGLIEQCSKGSAKGVDGGGNYDELDQLLMQVKDRLNTILHFV